MGLKLYLQILFEDVVVFNNLYALEVVPEGVLNNRYGAAVKREADVDGSIELLLAELSELIEVEVVQDELHDCIFARYPMCSFKDLLEFPIEEVPELRFLFPVVDLAKQRLYFVYLFFGLVAKK